VIGRRHEEIGVVGAHELGKLVDGHRDVGLELARRAAHAPREDAVDQLVGDHAPLQGDLGPLARRDVTDHRGQEPRAAHIEAVQPDLDVELRAVQPAMPPFEPLRVAVQRLGHQAPDLVRRGGSAGLANG